MGALFAVLRVLLACGYLIAAVVVWVTAWTPSYESVAFAAFVATSVAFGTAQEVFK